MRLLAAASRRALGRRGRGGGARGVARRAARARRAAFALRFDLVKKLNWIDRVGERRVVAGAGRVHARQGADPAGASGRRRPAAARDPHRRPRRDACRSSSTPASARRCRCSSAAAICQTPICRAARSVLRAAALTYVAAALATLLDVARWFRICDFKVGTARAARRPRTPRRTGAPPTAARPAP